MVLGVPIRCLTGKLISAVFRADIRRWLSAADSSACVHAALVGRLLLRSCSQPNHTANTYRVKLMSWLPREVCLLPVYHCCSGKLVNQPIYCSISGTKTWTDWVIAGSCSLRNLIVNDWNCYRSIQEGYQILSLHWLSLETTGQLLDCQWSSC